jgi:hypothetical protein
MQATKAEINTLTEDRQNSSKETIQKDRLKFAEHLQAFITGRTDDEDEQKKMLEIAAEQFKGAPLHMLRDDCKKCYGRGFIGFNSEYDYYEFCRKCFKGI